MVSSWDRVVVALLVVAVVAASISAVVLLRAVPASGDVRQLTAPVRDCGLLLSFRGEEELKDHLRRPALEGPVAFGGDVVSGFARLGAAEGGASISYSGTNNQVEGVDEADIVKTDGAYIYTVVIDDDGSSVAIVKAYPPDGAGVVSKIHTGSWIQGLFVNGDRLVVLDGGWYAVPLAGRTVESGFVGETWRSELRMLVYDIADRGLPTLVRNVTLTGSYVASRMIGDHVYVVAQDYLILSEQPSPLPFISVTELILPTIWTDGVPRELRYADIGYFADSEGSNVATIVLALDLRSEDPPMFQSFLTRGVSQTYVSATNMYIAGAEWEYDPTTGAIAESSTIHKVAISGGEVGYVCSVRVPGTILNQFSMDEHRADLRVATTLGQASPDGWETTSGVYVFDATLEPLGNVTKIAPGERIFSARFLGDRAYLVTFRVIDPLFVLDLSDPAAPRVLGHLKIPGVSNYLHPYDERHILGFGLDTFEGPDGIPRIGGLKLSLFDVEDVEHPREVAKYVIGDSGAYSEAVYDAKAFLFIPSRSLIVIPVAIPKLTDLYAMWMGVYVISVTPEAGFALRGTLTDADVGQDPDNASWYWSGAIRRSLSAGDYLYTVSNSFVTTYSIEGLARVARVSL